MTQLMSDDEIIRRAQQIVKKREEEKERQEQIREKLKKDKEEHEKKYELLIKIAKNKFSISLTLSYEIILALELEEKYKKLVEQIRTKRNQKREKIEELFLKKLLPVKKYLKIIDKLQKKEEKINCVLETKRTFVLSCRWKFEERVKQLVTEIVTYINELYKCPIIQSRPDILSDFKKTETKIQAFLQEEKWMDHKKLFQDEPYTIKEYGEHVYIEKMYGITYQSWINAF